jgi:hypothetical protein
LTEEEVEDKSVLELGENEDVEESIDKELETILLSAQREKERESLGVHRAAPPVISLMYFSVYGGLVGFLMFRR